MKKIKHDYLWHSRNGFKLCAYWRREDSLDVCVQNMSNFLNDFIKLCPSWLPFRWQSKGVITSCNDVVPSSDVLREIIVAGIGQCTDNAGSTVIFESAIRPINYRKLISIILSCGACSGAYNQPQMKFPPKNEEATDIISKEFFKKCYDLFLKHWQPRQGFISLPYYPVKEYSEKSFIIQVG
jgi:hypothetical protein